MDAPLPVYCDAWRPHINSSHGRPKQLVKIGKIWFPPFRMNRASATNAFEVPISSKILTVP